MPEFSGEDAEGDGEVGLPTRGRRSYTAQNGAKIRWFLVIFSATLSDAWHGLLEDAVADRAHLMQDGFEFAMICILAF